MQNIRAKYDKIKSNPSQINLLGDMLETIIKVQDDHQRIQSSQIITEAIQFYCSRVLTPKNSRISQDSKNSIAKYLSSKIKAFQLVILSMSQQFSRQCMDLLVGLYKSIESHQDLKEKFIQLIFDGIENYKSLDWSQLQYASLIQSLCSSFTNKSIKKQKLKYIIKFFTNLPSYANLTFNQIDKETLGTKLKENFQKLVISIIQSTQLQQQQQIQMFRNLGDKVFSKLSSPLLMSQYLLTKFNQRPTIQIEVLSSLFILVGKYGLEFQGFFDKLEILIRSKDEGKSVYELPNSKRFFRLVQSALKSSKIPLQIVLKILKIIIHQTFEERPEFCYWALSLTVNLVKKHRQLLPQITQSPQIKLLRKHYSPRIRSLLTQLDQNLNKAQYLDIDKFSHVKVQKMIKAKIEDLQTKLTEQDNLIFRVPRKIEKI